MKVSINPIKLTVQSVKSNMTVEGLAKKSGICVSTLSKIRTGGQCRLETAVRIANALGVEVTDLLEE